MFSTIKSLISQSIDNESHPKFHHLINGQKTESSSLFEVYNPLKNICIASVSDGSNKETQLAIQSASYSYSSWKALSMEERTQLLSKLGNAMIENEQILGTLITLEQGKPIKEAIDEIRYAASFLFSAVQECLLLKPDIINAPNSDKHLVANKVPFGVIGCITPWNFPSAMITRKIGPALGVGNTVVIKPSELTPLSALAIGFLAHDLGFPPGVINIVNGVNAKLISDEMLSNPIVRKLSFTGSTNVGKSIINRSSKNITKLSLELGGHAPFIVCEDANLDLAINATIQSKFRNSGQTCISANRFYIHHSIQDKFIKKLQDTIARLNSGDGLDPNVSLGPLINGLALQKIASHVKDAQEKGAKLIFGGERLSLNDYPHAHFFSPTILIDCNHYMTVFQEETFGPICGIMNFHSDQDVISLANDSIYGLAAYIFSNDSKRASTIASQLDYGIIGINDGSPSNPHAPFGGMKSSGIGREGGKYGVEAYTELKYICSSNFLA